MTPGSFEHCRLGSVVQAQAVMLRTTWVTWLWLLPVVGVSASL